MQTYCRRLKSWKLLKKNEQLQRSLEGVQTFLHDLCLAPEVTVELWWHIARDQGEPRIEFWFSARALSIETAERLCALFERDSASHHFDTPQARHDLTPRQQIPLEWDEEQVGWGNALSDQSMNFFEVAERLSFHHSSLTLCVRLSAASSGDLNRRRAYQEFERALWSSHEPDDSSFDTEQVLSSSQPTKSLIKTTLHLFSPTKLSSYEHGLLERGFGHHLILKTTPSTLTEMVLTPKRASLLLPFPRLCRDSHLATIDPLPSLPTPRGDYSQGLLFGVHQRAGRPQELRVALDCRHHYVIGQTGTGKSTHLLSLIHSAIEQRERAVFVLDPHGELAETALAQVAPRDHDRVLYIDLSDTEHFIGLNLLEAQDASEREFLIGELDQMFLNLYGPEMWGPRLQDIFRNTAYAISLDPDEPKTLIDLVWASDLSDTGSLDYFRRAMGSPNAPITLQLYFEQIQRQSTNQGSLREAIAYFRGKFSPFIDNIYTRNILGQSRSTIDFNQLIRDRRVVIFNLAKGQISSRYSTLIGKLLSLKIFQSVIRSPSRTRPEAMVVLDEFQNFIGGAFNTILSEGRKYGVSLVLAHQHLSQLQESGFEVGGSAPLLDAVLGNVGSMTTFRVSNRDAKLIAPHVGWGLTPQHFSALPNWSAITRLTLGRHLEPPLLFETVLRDSELTSDSQIQRMKRRSIEEACRPRGVCEDELKLRIMHAQGRVKVTKNRTQNFIHRSY